MGFLSHLAEEEFQIAPYEWIRPHKYSIEERLVNACHFMAKRGKHPESLTINEDKFINCIQSMGSRVGFTLQTVYGTVQLLKK